LLGADETIPSAGTGGNTIASGSTQGSVANQICLFRDFPRLIGLSRQNLYKLECH
jgi:hypothetical protein